LTVTLTYSDETTKAVALADFNTNGLTASPANETVMAVATHNGKPVVITHTASGKTASTGNLTVTEATVAVTGVSVSPTTLSFEVGDELVGKSITASIEPANATSKQVVWTIDGYGADKYRLADNSNPTSTTVNAVTLGAPTDITAVTVYCFEALELGDDVVVTVTTVDGGKTAGCIVTVTVETDALATAKTNAKQTLVDALAGYTQDNYSTDNWTALNTAKTNGDTAIDNATTLAAVDTAKQAALDAMAAVETTTGGGGQDPTPVAGDFTIADVDLGTATTIDKAGLAAKVNVATSGQLNGKTPGTIEVTKVYLASDSANKAEVLGTAAHLGDGNYVAVINVGASAGVNAAASGLEIPFKVANTTVY
jgi:hypothetical protein